MTTEQVLPASDGVQPVPPPSPPQTGGGERLPSPLPPSIPLGTDDPDGRPFSVADEATLGWVIRRVADARSRLAEHRATAAKLRDDVERWLAAETRREERSIEFMVAHAVSYLRERQTLDDGLKSIVTPWGTVQSRAQQPHHHRSSRFDEWARAEGYTRDPEPPPVDWARVKRECVVRGEQLVVEATGEIVPGVTVEHRPPSYSVLTP